MNGLLRLRSFAAMAVVDHEVCELCGIPLGTEHDHVADVGQGVLRCACPPCRLLFMEDGAGAGKIRALPNRYARIEIDRTASPSPVDVCFYIASSRYGLAGFYPGPGGAVASELPAPDWPALRELVPDVEALLVRGDSAFIVPVTVAYELTGLIRNAWTGFSGGDAVAVIDEFFVRLGGMAMEVLA